EYEQTTSTILCSSHSFIALAWETPTVGRPTRNGLFGRAAGSRPRRLCSWLKSSSSLGWTAVALMVTRRAGICTIPAIVQALKPAGIDELVTQKLRRALGSQSEVWPGLG